MIHLTKNVRPATDKQFMVFGERNTGTNFLSTLVTQNFQKKYTWPMVWKHWVGFITESDYSPEKIKDMLAIGIIRDPVDWLSSMRMAPPHAPHMAKKDWVYFLQTEWYTRHDDKRNGKAEFNYEIMEDRDFETGKRYENILKLRSKKLSWLLDPPLPCPYILIRYEDLKTNTVEVMRTIGQTFGWRMPANFRPVARDMRHGGKYKPRSYPRPTPEAVDIIRSQLDWDLEAKVGYKMI
jgi:hypothetical protein